MKTLAIVSGTYLQMPLVIKAKEMGLRTICFMWEKGAVCKDYVDKFYPISIIEKDQILEVCQKERIDAITTIASDLAVLTVNYVAGKMGLISNSDQYSLITTNKYMMRQCFVDAEIPSPKFCRINKTLSLGNFNFTYPLIVKPTDRSGSRGVEKIDNPKQLIPAIQRAMGESFHNEAIIEEYVEGREISVESISWQGKHYILQITDKVTTEAPYFVELEHHQPSSLPENIKHRIRSIVLKALTALHVQYGASHSELKITKDGDIKIIEVGARMGGDFIGSDLVQLSTGYDFVKGVINVALGQFSEPKITEQKYSGVYFLCKETECIKQYIERKEKYPEIIKAEITDNELKNIQYSGDRSGYFIYQSDKGRFKVDKQLNNMK